jgi:hypothetical protein
MSLAMFTRPDGSPVAINGDEVLTFYPVPPDGPLAGPLKTGTRIEFKNGRHQDVKELVEEVARKLGAG